MRQSPVVTVTACSPVMTTRRNRPGDSDTASSSDDGSCCTSDTRDKNNITNYKEDEICLRLMPPSPPPPRAGDIINASFVSDSIYSSIIPDNAVVWPWWSVLHARQQMRDYMLHFISHPCVEATSTPSSQTRVLLRHVSISQQSS